MPSYGFPLCTHTVFAEQTCIKMCYVTLLQISLIKIQILLFHHAVETIPVGGSTFQSLTQQCLGTHENMVQQFRGKNRKNVFSSFFQYSGLLSEFILNFSSVTRKAIMYKWYKNTSLSKILQLDYHSSLTQWSSVVLFIRWAAEGGNIFLKVSTILFSFQIHFLRVCFLFVFFFLNTQLLLCLSRFLVLSPVFMPSLLSLACEIHYVGFLWI